MRYSSIRSMDVSNGEHVGVALFVQGCRFHCKNCFNPETWDFNGGKEWTPEVKKKFLGLMKRDFIKRVTILGGEPLEDENLDGVLDLIRSIHDNFCNIKLWLYTGYKVPAILFESDWKYNESDMKRKQILELCDIVVDGPYIDSMHDSHLKWKGSANQRVLNIRETLRAYNNSDIKIDPRSDKDYIVSRIGEMLQVYQ